MLSDYIFDRTVHLVRHCGTRNPFDIAQELGVKVYIRNDFTRLKGMYSVIKRNRCIFINGNLPEHTQSIICAHELGHDALHRKLAKNTALQEFMLYDMKSRPEFEANIYAAHLLIDENEILELTRGEHDIFQIASEMRTDINLMLIKINEMNRQGYQFNLPYIPRGDFLGED